MGKYICTKCGYRWKAGLSLIPKCPKCGSHWVMELRRSSQYTDYDSVESASDAIGEQGLGL